MNPPRVREMNDISPKYPHESASASPRIKGTSALSDVKLVHDLDDHHFWGASMIQNHRLE